MTNKGFRLTAGLLTAAVMITSLPTQALASQNVASDKYMTGTAVSFSAGATAAINETVVLNDTNALMASVTEQDAPVVATAVEDYSNMAIANVNECLYIRAEANTEAEVLGKLYAKGAATVLETLDGWYKVESGSVTGYVSADYVIVGDEAVCKDASERIATITTETLKLRKEASTEAGVYTLLSGEQKVTVVDETAEGWLKVKFNNYEGYISSEYASVETVYEYAESKEEEAARLQAEREAAEREEAERRRREEASAQKAADKAAREEAARKSYNPPAGGSGQSVVDYAVQFVGNPYVYGGSSLTNGADCSGFVMAVYGAFGVSLPHSSSALRNVGYGVSASEVQPGDIICYKGHAAIYIGNGAIVHASNKKDGIKISYNWQYKNLVAIRRIF